jgi:hypothetical protein
VNHDVTDAEFLELSPEIGDQIAAQLGRPTVR